MALGLRALLMCLCGCAALEGPLLVEERADTDGNTDADSGTGGDTDGSAPGTTTAGPLQPGMRLQYQLVETLDDTANADVFVIDLFEQGAEQVAQLHALGRVVIAYVAAGSHEPWRDDADDFPEAALGAPLDGFPNERWLDVRDPDVRALQAARITLAATKGFDGVLLSGLDGYLAESGHDLSAADQLDYARWLASRAHDAGLVAGLSSAWALASELAPDFDFAIHLNCVANTRCDELSPFEALGKAVFDLETTGDFTSLCAESARLELPITLKREGFDAWLQACP